MVYQEPADFSPVLGGWVHPRSDDDNNIYSTEVDFEIVDNSNCNTQYNVQLKEDQFCAKPKNENIYIELVSICLNPTFIRIILYFTKKISFYSRQILVVL